MSDLRPILDRRTVPSVAIVGNDAMLAAAPATPVQFAHACLQRGFTVAVPASWGDELIATHAARRLAWREKGPAVMCACPRVRARLLAPGPVLAPFLVSLVAPPVAVARYLRSAYGETAVHLTYIGDCPGADDPSIDARITPDAFLLDIAEHGIALSEQPLVFDSIVPPDRRRWASLPGGVPTAEILWNESDGRTLVEVDRDDVAADVAQHIIAQEHVLIDVAPGLGCACSGAPTAVDARTARAAVTALEPPRALAPVIDASVAIALDLPLEPAAAAGDTRVVQSSVPEETLRSQPGGGGAPSTTLQTRALGETPGATSDDESGIPNVATVDIAAMGNGDSPVAATADEPEPASPPNLHFGLQPEAVARAIESLARPHKVPETVEAHSSQPGTLSEGGQDGEAASVRRRTPSPVPVRPHRASIPQTTAAAGRPLPRAYVAKRRTPPGGSAAVSPVAGEPPATADEVSNQVAPAMSAAAAPSLAGNQVAVAAERAAGAMLENGDADSRGTPSFDSGSLIGGAGGRGRISLLEDEPPRPRADDVAPAVTAAAPPVPPAPARAEPGSTATGSGSGIRGVLLGLLVIALVVLGAVVVWSLRP